MIASELRFKVGDKLQANGGEFVNGIVARQWECGSVFRIQLEDGDGRDCRAPQDSDAYVRARKRILFVTYRSIVRFSSRVLETNEKSRRRQGMLGRRNLSREK